jgi:hypothetical protein
MPLRPARSGTGCCAPACSHPAPLRSRRCVARPTTRSVSPSPSLSLCPTLCLSLTVSHCCAPACSHPAPLRSRRCVARPTTRSVSPTSLTHLLLSPLCVYGGMQASPPASSEQSHVYDDVWWPRPSTSPHPQHSSSFTPLPPPTTEFRLSLTPREPYERHAPPEPKLSPPRRVSMDGAAAAARSSPRARPWDAGAELESTVARYVRLQTQVRNSDATSGESLRWGIDHEAR